jgi:peptide/nickel transport system ATP-binding protein
LQLVPQDPGPSFVPHWPTWRVVAESALIDGVDPAEARARASAALEQVGLGEPQLQRTPLQLSGGERRRVAIARAILADSRLLVFDESFSGLDGPRQREMLQLLQALRRRRGLTLVTISHDLRLLRRIAERVLILENGRIVEDGPVDRVLAAPHSSAGQRLCAAEYRAGPFA